MRHYVALMRPRQWIKNLAVLAGPVFAMSLDPASMIRCAYVFGAFCLAASASYAINDLIDRHADALHPTKKFRPIAAGNVSPAGAVAWSALLITVSLTVCIVFLNPVVTALVAGYFVLVLAYSLSLKKRMILDVIIIAVGFVIRTVAGAEAVDAYVSPWLIVCTFTLCMFMGFGKRRCEIDAFTGKGEAASFRKTLTGYTPELLNNLISVSAGIAVMTFLLYTMDADTPTAFPKRHLLYTLPMVIYGVFRYAMLVQSGRIAGPTEIFIHDRPFIGTILIWALVAGVVVTEPFWAGGSVLALTDLAQSPHIP